MLRGGDVEETPSAALWATRREDTIALEVVQRGASCVRRRPQQRGGFSGRDPTPFTRIAREQLVARRSEASAGCIEAGTHVIGELPRRIVGILVGIRVAVHPHEELFPIVIDRHVREPSAAVRQPSR